MTIVTQWRGRKQSNIGARFLLKLLLLIQTDGFKTYMLTIIPRKPLRKYQILYIHMGDLGSIPGLGRSPGEWNGYPLQYSSLENSIDKGS